jgi:hypothetical protein
MLAIRTLCGMKVAKKAFAALAMMMLMMTLRVV